MTTDTARLQAMLADACFGDSARAFTGDLSTFLARHDLDAADAQALLDGPRRLGLYRQLVRHNVVHVVRTMLPQTRTRLEAHAAGAFDGTVDAFLAEVGPRTPHLRDVPRELLDWATPRWRADSNVMPWIAEYAELELADFTIGVLPGGEHPSESDLTEVTPTSALVFARPHLLLHLAWAVHELPVGDMKVAPEARSVHLLIYRDAEYRPHVLDVSALAAAILEHLFAGRVLADAMREACASSGRPLDDSVLAGVARLLADLGERGVLLGARST